MPAMARQGICASGSFSYWGRRRLASERISRFRPSSCRARRSRRNLSKSYPAAVSASMLANRLENVTDIDSRVFLHQNTLSASLSTRSRIVDSRPDFVTTSTLRFRRSSRKSLSATRSIKLKRTSGSTSTRTSMSLSVRASPRMTDPKTASDFSPRSRSGFSRIASAVRISSFFGTKAMPRAAVLTLSRGLTRL
jgi:hypothetical protein